MDNYKIKKIVTLTISSLFIGVTTLLNAYNIKFKEFISNYILPTYPAVIIFIILIAIIFYLLLGFTNTHKSMDLNNINWRWKYRKANKILIPVDITPYCQKCSSKVEMNEYKEESSNGRSFKKTKMICTKCDNIIIRNTDIDGVISYIKTQIKKDIGTFNK